MKPPKLVLLSVRDCLLHVPFSSWSPPEARRWLGGAPEPVDASVAGAP